MGAELEFHTDPRGFLDAAGAHLARDPVLNTVVTTVADRAASAAAEGRPGQPGDWWLVVRDGTGAVVGAGMRTAPFALRPAFLLPMPEEAALLLARSLHGRGEDLTAVNGALPAAQTCAGELARLTGGAVRVAQHTRLFELGELVAPRPARGALRVGTVDDVDLAMAWYEAFGRDADEQARRLPGDSFQESPDTEEMLRRIRAGLLWFWVDDTGERVHLTATNAPALGVVRVGPVYTPGTARGRGFASAAVAEVSQRILARGHRVCLFTDQANPTSNRVYTALGYRPVADMANLVVVR